MRIPERQGCWRGKADRPQRRQWPNRSYRTWRSSLPGGSRCRTVRWRRQATSTAPAAPCCSWCAPWLRSAENLVIPLSWQQRLEKGPVRRRKRRWAEGSSEGRSFKTASRLAAVQHPRWRKHRHNEFFWNPRAFPINQLPNMGQYGDIHRQWNNEVTREGNQRYGACSHWPGIKWDHIVDQSGANGAAILGCARPRGNGLLGESPAKKKGRNRQFHLNFCAFCLHPGVVAAVSHRPKRQRPIGAKEGPRNRISNRGSFQCSGATVS